jgi:hypothetical protein
MFLPGFQPGMSQVVPGGPGPVANAAPAEEALAMPELTFGK